jgi:WD40 repeat protein
MASGSWDGTTVLWDLTDPTHPRRIGEPLVGPEEGVNAVAFAPDGRTVATAGVNGTTLLWDLTDPDRPRRMGEPLSGQGRAINAVAFSHDGNTLATAGEDGTAVLWDMRPSYEFRDQALARACAATGGGFDPSAWSNAIPDVPYSDPCPSA